MHDRQLPGLIAMSAKGLTRDASHDNNCTTPAPPARVSHGGTARLKWISLALLPLALSACSRGDDAGDNGDWQQLGQWTGSDSLKTEIFETHNDSGFRIRWTSKPGPSAGGNLLTILVFQDNDFLDTIPVNFPGSKTDTAFVKTYHGKYYMKIRPGNATFDVTAEETLPK
jgi:hypothetical protein